MPTTGSPYNLPYPAGSDGPVGPVQMQALAVATASAITTTTGTVAANAAAALTSAVATLNATIGPIQSSVTALVGLNIGPRITALEQDTGWVSAGFTADTGWSFVLSRYRVFMNKFVYLEIDALRTGAAIPTNSQGAMTANQVCTIPAASRPFTTQYTIFDGANTSGSCSIASTGPIILRDAHSTSSIANGAIVRIRASYVKVA